ncbi:MAG: hypothetical protein FWH29_09275 [Methanobrevibacter sp.]|nr:hypothetical protein [Methanobrevibacter sp.]
MKLFNKLKNLNSEKYSEHSNKDDLATEIANQLFPELGIGKASFIVDGDPDNINNLLVPLSMKGDMLLAEGKMDEAMDCFKKVEKICREHDNKDFLSSSLGNQSLILLKQNDLDGAMELLIEKEQCCREINKISGLVPCIFNQGYILYLKNQVDKGLDRMKEATNIALECGSTDLYRKYTNLYKKFK